MVLIIEGFDVEALAEPADVVVIVTDVSGPGALVAVGEKVAGFRVRELSGYALR